MSGQAGGRPSFQADGPMNRLGEKWSSGFFSTGGADDSGLVVAEPAAPPDPDRDDDDDGLAVLLLSAPLDSGAAVVPSAAAVGLGVVVGPAVDVKLVAMQAGMFGRAFAARFAPATFLVAVASACAVGFFVLGGR